MSKRQRFLAVFAGVVAVGVAMAATMSFWMWFWPEAAFIGSLTTFAAFAFASIAAFAE
jgi:hypothetical protein